MADQRARRGRLCSRCGKHRVRSLRSIAKELAEFQRATPHLALLWLAEHRKKDLEKVQGDDAALNAYADGVGQGLNEGHARDLSDELLGDCVYCAHTMDPQRRAALRALEQAQKGARHG